MYLFPSCVRLGVGVTTILRFDVYSVAYLYLISYRREDVTSLVETHFGGCSRVDEHPVVGANKKKHRLFYTLDASFACRGEHIRGSKTGGQVTTNGSGSYRLNLEVQ